MKTTELLSHWQKNFGGQVTKNSYQLHLNVKDAARVEALVEMFPASSRERILSDLVSAALNDLAGQFPYQAGQQVIAEDEAGDPIYEDNGLTPTFLQLTRKHLSRL
ncbi:hypothetical protein GCM10011297_17650 [Bacterioplanes sanyensis]|uniref:type 1 pili tip component n=1 Tax=Bacterioplanes sanyensis TaxID=1249553 RepID=UPI00167426C5|nr:type 1 pili tip component [Bacterioplanes sanyensis]GGY45107.1 hypothetical protein GCM10011297_17650 [Bacterioplanes sanyensis]